MANFSLNEQDRAVYELLSSAGIKYIPEHTGERHSDEGWRHDSFRVTFVKGSTRETFDFSAGTGHRLKVRPLDLEAQALKEHAELLDLKSSSAIVSDYRVPLPTAASVLYGLMIDSSALDESFENWCWNFGYDSDSISAFNMYQSCCKNGKKLHNVFNRELIEKLEDILQDY